MRQFFINDLLLTAFARYNKKGGLLSTPFSVIGYIDTRHHLILVLELTEEVAPPPNFNA